MTDYKLVPVEPTPEMVGAAEDAYMPFGDMELAVRMAVLAAPAVQWEPVAWVTADIVDGQAVNGKSRRVWWENIEGVGMPIYTAPQPAEQKPLPCQECGGDGAGGEHEEDCGMAQPAPDVGELIEALEELMLRAHPAYVHDDLMREKLIAARELGHAALSSHREQQPAPDVAMRVMEALAAILRKAQGRTDTETGECIDVGAECMAIRREFDRSSKAARGVSGLVEAAEAALGEIEDIMQEAYNSAYPVCCGRAGSECCGSPDPEWDEADQRLMGRLDPHQKALRAALAARRKQGGDHDNQ